MYANPNIRNASRAIDFNKSFSFDEMPLSLLNQPDQDLFGTNDQ